MAYRVSVRPAAARDLRRLRGALQIALHGAILTLSHDPRPPGTIKLTGVRNTWRVRIKIDGVPWRIVYQIDDQRRWVRVMRVARRDESTHRDIG